MTNKENNTPFDMALVNDDESKVVIVAEIIVKELLKKFFRLYKEAEPKLKNVQNKGLMEVLKEVSKGAKSKRKRKSLEISSGIYNKS